MAEPEENTADEDAKDTSSASPNDEHAEAGTSSMTPATEGGVGKDEEPDKTDPADETADEAARKADTTDDTSNSPGSGTTEEKGNDSNNEEPKIEEDKTEEPITEEKKKADTKAADAPKKEEKPLPAAAADDAGTKPNDLATGPVVSSTKRTRPPYKYDPEKVVLRFLFANRDGLTVTVECKPADTVGEVKAQLLSVWPDDLPECGGGDYLRLICMGKGMLMPDTRTLEDCQVPVFKTHPTPVNVAVRPKTTYIESSKSSKEKSASVSTPGNSAGRTTEQTGQGCGCVIQ
mmetsp:Transcript_17230/g.41886  ORF Transcript_17230/g.41886 Transcript_17230/m.41886 type:complete len:290 (+) Transcript_17230:81-950(+)